MSRPIIVCDKISKSYRLGSQEGERHRPGAQSYTLRNALSNSFHSALQYLKSSRSRDDQEGALFWALRDVSFEIQPR